MKLTNSQKHQLYNKTMIVDDYEWVPCINHVLSVLGYDESLEHDENYDVVKWSGTDPLIKDEKIRKAVRAWAEAGGLEHFTVVNEHFNCCKIMGRKYNRVSKIEFLTTIPDATHRTYTIAELCGEEEE